jgi:hypothetical protein
MIYTFGNSHAHLFTNSSPGTIGIGENKNKNFISFSLGPVIAYNFMQHHYQNLINAINNSAINKEKDYILLVVGEVDCRWHLPLQSNERNIPINDIVSECIDRFFNTHISLSKMGYRVIGWGGHPSTTDPHSNDPSQPIFGDCLTRNIISKLWDSKMRDKCEENNIPHISIIDQLINNDGLTKMEYFSDYCHLNYDKLFNIIDIRFNKFYDTNSA